MKKALSFTTAILAAVCIFSAGAKAQTLESSYFLDNYTYSYRLNPAIMPDNGFVAFGIGNITAGVDSKMGVGSFLYPASDGKLVTGLNSSVSSSDFLSKFSKSNRIGENLNLNIFSFGLRSEKSMTTVEVNVREDFASNLPDDLFSFLKNGTNPSPYDFSALGASSNAMAEFAVGHTRQFGNLVVGLRAKLLLGMASASLGFDNLDLTCNGSALGVDEAGSLKIACKPLALQGSTINDLEFSSENLGLAGFGLGFDLGAKWNVNDNLSATFGINDIGGVSWKYNTVLATQLNTNFEGLSDIGTDTKLADALKDYWEEVKSGAELTSAEAESGFEGLPFNVNAGVRYRLPFYDKASVGFISNYTNYKYAASFSARAGATVTPFDCFSFTANAGVSNYGVLTGCMASLTLLRINLFAGFDGYMGKLANVCLDELDSEFASSLPIKNLKIPVNSFNCRLSAGMTILLDKK